MVGRGSTDKVLVLVDKWRFRARQKELRIEGTSKRKLPI
jgi:hypothetical protein